MKRIITIDIETLPIDASPDANLFWENETGFRDTALDGALGRIFCIGYMEQDETGKIIEHGCFGWNDLEQNFEMDEAKLLREFWEYLQGFNLNRDIIIGHNILEFDLPFIKKRSFIHEIKPTVNFSFYKYQKEPIFDTMLHFDSWFQGKNKTTGLKKLAYAFGLDCPKEVLGELNVYDAFCAKQYRKLHDYCKGDVKATHLIWRKLSGRNTNVKSMALAS